MKIWANGKWVSARTDLLIIHLTDQDKKNIANMHKDCSIYSEYSSKNFSTNEVMMFLKKVKKEL